MVPDCIYFINKYHTKSFFILLSQSFGLWKKISNSFCPHAYIQLYELTARYIEHRHLCLSSCRFSYHGLTSSRWSIQENAPRHFDPHFLIFLLVLHEINHVKNSFFGCFTTSNIIEVYFFTLIILRLFRLIWILVSYNFDHEVSKVCANWKS